MAHIPRKGKDKLLQSAERFHLPAGWSDSKSRNWGISCMVRGCSGDWTHICPLCPDCPLLCDPCFGSHNLRAHPCPIGGLHQPSAGEGHTPPGSPNSVVLDEPAAPPRLRAPSPSPSPPMLPSSPPNLGDGPIPEDLASPVFGTQTSTEAYEIFARSFVPLRTAQHTTARHSTAQHSTAQHSTALT